jgi:hypothetical protein
MKVGRLTARRNGLAITLALTILSGTESVTLASSSGAISVSSTLLELNLQIGCTVTTTGSISAGGGGSSTINLSNCFDSNFPNCTVVSSGPEPANVELVQVGGSLFEKFTPTEGYFGHLEYLGSGCALNEAAAGLSGSFAGREATAGLTENRTLSFTKGKSETWPAVELKLGKKPAILAGELTQHLSGSLEDAGWGPIWQGTHGGWEVQVGSPFATSETVQASGGTKFSATLEGGLAVSFSCSTAGAVAANLVPGGTESAKSFTFSGCKVEAPATCSLPGNSLSTGPVTGTLLRVNGKIYEKFTPVGSEFGWVEFAGASCPLTGVGRELKGSFAALAPEAGVLMTSHSLALSDAANEATGSQLILGTRLVHLSGSLEQRLSGPGLGTQWSAY